MSGPQYETVTEMPVLIFADLLPGEQPDGTDTFGVSIPEEPPLRRKSDKSVRPARSQEISWKDRQIIALGPSDLDPRSARGKKIWNILGESAKEELVYVITLRNKLQNRERYSLDDIKASYRFLAARALHTDLDVDWEPDYGVVVYGRLPKREPVPGSDADRLAEDLEHAGRHPTIVAGITTDEMEQARLVLWWNKERFLPAIFCADLRTAVHVLSLPIFSGGTGLAVCRRCQSLFVRARADKQHCSDKCQNSDKVARWRRKQRAAS